MDNLSLSLKLLEYDEHEFARQLCLLEFNIFSRIQSTEFMGQAWSKPKESHRSPNILALIEDFNNISNG